MKIKFWLLLSGVIFISIAILILRTTRIPEEKDCLSLKGTVISIYEAGVKDVVFQLREQNKIFYVNRGLERGLNVETLKTALIEQKITIKFANYWTPLDPFSSNIRISKIEHQGRTVFTEY